MNLASRIAAKIPIDGVTVEIRADDTATSDGVGLESGYNIFFKFPNIKLEAIHHTNTLNLSNAAVDKMVKNVAVSFRDMMREASKNGTA